MWWCSEAFNKLLIVISLCLLKFSPLLMFNSRPFAQAKSLAALQDLKSIQEMADSWKIAVVVSMWQPWSRELIRLGVISGVPMKKAEAQEKHFGKHCQMASRIYSVIEVICAQDRVAWERQSIFVSEIVRVGVCTCACVCVLNMSEMDCHFDCQFHTNDLSRAINCCLVWVKI